MELRSMWINNYNLMCRLCLATDDCLQSVFDESSTYLPQRIAACVNVEIYETDKMPTAICKSCLTKIEIWHDFKVNCDDSQAKLRQWTNNVICNTTSNMTFEIKDEIEFVSSDPIQVETEVKTEPNINSEFNFEENLNIYPIPCDPSTLELSESLLVPTYECPAAVHGLNNPLYNENKGISSLSKNCRICHKEFSNSHNRMRHERNVHTVNINSFNEILMEYESQIKPEIINIQSIHSTDSINNNANDTADISNDVNILKVNETVDINNIENETVDINNIENETITYNTSPNQTSNVLQLAEHSVNALPEEHFIKYNQALSKMFTTFSCIFCGIEYTKTKGILRHLSKMLVLEKFSCYSCCIAFPNRSQYMKHASKKYCKQRARLINDKDCSFKAYQHYECRICGELHVHKILLNRHLIRIHLKKSYPSSCDRCDKPFKNRNDYKLHLQESCFYKIYCSICKIAFEADNFFEHCKIHNSDNLSEFNLTDYIVNKNNDCRNRTIKANKDAVNNVNKYSCSTCGVQFPNLDLWCEHQHIHSDNDVHKCNECNRVFVSQVELDQHKSSHANIKLRLYRCSASNSYKAVSEFPSSTNSSQTEEKYVDIEMKRKKKSQNYQKHFKCPKCKKLFSSRGNLSKHKRNIHDNKIMLGYIKKNQLRKRKCPKCNKFVLKLSVHKQMCIQKKENIEEKGMQNGVACSHICSICKRSFMTERGLFAHYKFHKSKENDYSKMNCQICSAEFLSIDSLLDHIKSHSKNSENMSNIFSETPLKECKICGKTFLSNKGLAIHLRVHSANITSSPTLNIKTEPTSDSVKCNFCNMEFENRAALNPHIKIHLNGANIAYNCTFCPKICANSYLLASHVKYRHTNETNGIKIKLESFPCDLCKKKFNSESLLQKHLKTHSKVSIPKKIKCQSCFKTFSSNVALKRHSKTNCLCCTECNKSFTTQQAFVSHRRWHEHQNVKIELTCTECSIDFSSKKSFDKHMKTHTNTFKCKLCPKAFLYLKSLENHTAVCHENEDIKPNPFNFKNINNKTKIKSEKPCFTYKCTDCNTSFVNAKQLRVHVLTIHMENPNKL